MDRGGRVGRMQGRRQGKVESEDAHQNTDRDVHQGAQGTPQSQWEMGEWGGKHGLEVEQGRN